MMLRTKIFQQSHRVTVIFRHILERHARIFWITFWLFVFQAVLHYIQPYILSRLFLQVTRDNFSWSFTGTWGMLLIMVMLMGILIESYAVRLDIDFLARLTKTLMHEIYSKLLYFDITLHENESSGKYLGKARRAVDKIISGVDQILYQFLPAFIEIIFVHSVFLFYSVDGGLILTGTLIVMVAFNFFVSYFLNQIFSEAFEQENKVAGFFVESLSLIRTIRFFGKEDYYHDRGEEEFGKVVTIWRKKMNQMTLFFILKGIFFWSQTGILVALVIWQYQVGHLTDTAGLFLLLLTSLYMRSLGSLSRLVDRMAEFFAGVNQYVETMEQKEKIIDCSETKPLPHTLRGEIIFDRVTFRYDGSQEDQFKQLSITFPPEKTTALVGQSGSGKSTIVKLLFRLYDVQGGSIRLDDIDIREFAQRQYRSILAIVPQDVELFNASIRENISLGDDYSDEEIWSVLQLAVLDERVRQMPNMLETQVGERGVKLSGGEKQRLGIARALIRRPKILVLDEATSSLDTLSEVQVKKAIYNLEHLGITIIVIAHRLSTIQDADEIIVFEAGEVVERGTHDELLAKQGKYYHLQGKQIIDDEGEAALTQPNIF